MSRMELANRLRRAREAAGLTVTEAAARFGFANYQTLSNIERGEREVKVSELAQFARTYFCNLNSFLMGEEAPKTAVHFLWRRAPAPEKRVEVEASISHRFEEYHLLERLLALDREESGSIISLTSSDIRNNFQVDALADKVGGMLNIGSRPAFSLQKAMEQKLMTKILFVEMSEFGSAAATVHPQLGAAIVVNSDEAPWRINFTLAHELFHIITWNLFTPEEIEGNKALFNELEKKADRFASTLLLPEAQVSQELSSRTADQKLSFSDIVDVAREFGVSTQALLYRMAKMRLIPWEKADGLARDDELKKVDRRIRKGGEYDAPISERFILLAVKCLRKGLISRGKFAELLSIDRADIDGFLEYRGLSEVEGESIEIVAS